MLKKTTILFIILSTVFNNNIVLANDNPAQITVYPTIEAIKILQTYKDKPVELYTSGPLKNHKFAQSAKEYIEKNNLTRLPVLRREGPYVIMGDSKQNEIKIRTQYENDGFSITLNSKMISSKKISSFADLLSEVTKAFEQKNKSSSNMHLLDLFLPKAQALTGLEIAGLVAVFTFFILVTKGVNDTYSQNDPDRFGKWKESIPEKALQKNDKCFQRLTEIEKTKASANDWTKEDLNLLISEFNGNLKGYSDEEAKNLNPIYRAKKAEKFLADFEQTLKDEGHRCSDPNDLLGCYAFYSEQTGNDRAPVNKRFPLDLAKALSSRKDSPLISKDSTTINTLECLYAYDLYIGKAIKTLKDKRIYIGDLYVNNNGSIGLGAYADNSVRADKSPSYKSGK